MVASYQLSAWYAILECYWVPEPIPSLFLRHCTLLFWLLANSPGHHWPSCHVYLLSVPPSSWLAQFYPMTLFPNRSWTLLFCKHRSMLLWWYASWAWIDRWLVRDRLYSRYWLLHSRQSCLVDNFKSSFQQCLKKGQFQCNSACSLSRLFFFSWCWYAWSFNHRW